VSASLLADGSVEGIVRDITERVRMREERLELEESLQHAQRLESVGRLAGGIAHDFNNLLSVIIGNAHLVRDAAGEGAREGIDQLLQASDQARELTRQLLAFSRQQVLAPRIVDLNAIVHHTQDMLARVLNENVELSAELAEDLGVIKADPTQLEQILVNLVVNASDAMSSGGQLKLRTFNTPPAQNDIDPLGSVVLVVADDGQGIPKDVLPHVMEPFFTTKAPTEGTGLGLSTVYGIVDQSGGQLDIRCSWRTPPLCAW